MKMTTSFYQYLMSQRQKLQADDISRFAEAAWADDNFPKQSSDYEEISYYLESQVGYLPSMTIFDQAWDDYLNKKAEF